MSFSTAHILTSPKYINQYASNDEFRYLFGHQYWEASDSYNPSRVTKYSAEGNYISKSNDSTAIVSDKSFAFLKDVTMINEMLAEKNETVVTDIEICSGRLTFLYIQCEKREYLIKLYDTSILPDIELYKLYSAKDVTNNFLSMLKKYNDEYYSGKSLAKNVVLEKPTYETEASALQSEGLLKGTENGLDLLKPLTRAESAAILLRVLGESETAPDNSVQTFSDVPAVLWSHGVTEKAYSLGIVNGIGDNLFAPEESVTSTQFATMALRAAHEQAFDWQNAVNIMIEKGILTEEETKTMDFFTRGDMAKIIFEAKQNGLF